MALDGKLRSALAGLRRRLAPAKRVPPRPPGLKALIEEAERRDIPWVPWPRPDMIQLGHGVRQRRVHAQRTERTSAIAQELSQSKEWTKAVLAAHGVPVAAGRTISALHQLPGAVQYCRFPLVIKPAKGAQGKAVAVDVRTWPEAVRAFTVARIRSSRVVVERYHPGNDYRMLVVNGRLAAAALRTPASVVGDGRSTVRALVEQLNADPRRGPGHENVLTLVRISRGVRRVLRRQGYRLSTVLPAGTVALLRNNANLSTGGTARDVTDVIHPETVRLVERVAALIGLDITGIDVVSPDIARPLEENGGVVIEVNPGPGLRMHFAPSEGTPRNVAGAILDGLFPAGTPARIPIVAVTGTNGKTTTVRLVAHLLAARGLSVGFCTTDGVYLGGRRVSKLDAAGPASARTVLRDPSVEAAVLEVARGALIRFGLGFDGCDVGMLLNVDSDHLGLLGIETLEDLARAKGAVLEAVRPGGLAVVNADDARTCEQASRGRGRIAYFSLVPDAPLVRAHVAQGGLAAVYDGDVLRLLDGTTSHSLVRAREVPITFGGRAPFMVANALAAALAAFELGMTPEAIGAALTTFERSPGENAGRMNLFPCGRVHALVDYAHNPPALHALAGFVRSWEGERIAVVGMAGDRRDEDYLAFGKLCAETFDRVIVREDRAARKRSRAEVVAAIAGGVRAAGTTCHLETVAQELAAVDHALTVAPDGALVVLLADDVDAVVGRLKSQAGGMRST
jgi:cyanophycin synthetase